MKHLKYGGSTAPRTLQCSAWANLADTLPTPPDSPAAAEGTLLHDAMEQYVLAPSNLGAGIDQELIDEKLTPAVYALEQVVAQYGIIKPHVEPFVQIGEDVGGSIDFLALSADGKTLIVLDYKFGHWKVPAQNNASLLFYALCALIDPPEGLDVEQVEKLALVIIQPENGDCTPDIWEQPVDVLDQFEDRLFDAVDAAEASPTTGYTATPGNACRFCPAEAICDAKTGIAAQQKLCSPEQTDSLAESMAAIPALESWIRAVRKMAFEQANLGNPPAGWKLVNKRPRRVWNDPVAARKRLCWTRGVRIAECTLADLKSPAQVEKVFKEKALDFSAMGMHISSVSSGETLAPIDDKRDAVIPLESLKLNIDTL